MTLYGNSALADGGTAAEKGRIHIEPSRILINEAVSIKAGNYVSYPLIDFTGGDRAVFSKLRVSVGNNNDVNVLLLNRENFKRYAERREFSGIEGNSEFIRGKRFIFFAAPGGAVYYLVLDNTGGSDGNIKDLVVSALYPQLLKEHMRVKGSYEELYSVLAGRFIFSDFNIYFGVCGEGNAYSNPDIFICNEFLDKLPGGHKMELGIWIFFHELGHLLLKQWNNPLWDNEDAADEFGTLLLIMAGYKEQVLQAVRQFPAERSAAAAGYLAPKDARDNILLQRAAKAGQWLNNPDELLLKWRRFLIPNLRTDLLNDLLSSPVPWTDLKPIEDELNRRKILQK